MCLDNQRCAGVVQHLQNVSLEVELRRRIANRRAVFDVEDIGFTRGYRSALDSVIAWLDQLCPDYSQCNNPPEDYL